MRGRPNFWLSYMHCTFVHVSMKVWCTNRPRQVKGVLTLRRFWIKHYLHHSGRLRRRQPPTHLLCISAAYPQKLAFVFDCWNSEIAKWRKKIQSSILPLVFVRKESFPKLRNSIEFDDSSFSITAFKFLRIFASFIFSLDAVIFRFVSLLHYSCTFLLLFIFFSTWSSSSVVLINLDNLVFNWNSLSVHSNLFASLLSKNLYHFSYVQIEDNEGKILQTSNNISFQVVSHLRSLCLVRLIFQMNKIKVLF